MLTIIFIPVVVTLVPFANFGGASVSVVVLVALLVCLIPTTIGALLSAIGIAGMDRLVQRNVLAMSGRAVEAAGDVQTLLLDKTGTITLGNRMASNFFPVRVTANTRSPTSPNWLRWRTRPPKVARSWCSRRSSSKFANVRLEGDARVHSLHRHYAHVGPRHRHPPDSQGRGRLGEALGPRTGRRVPADLDAIVERVSREGSTPLVVADGPDILGVIELKDVVKQGIREKFDEMRQMGIRTVMITGDNPLTAAAIAQEAGVDDFLAEATPEAKMALIKQEQEGGKLVAMTGDGTNDAPALAQADVGVAMNTGTTAAKEAGNMVDLDSNPTKLIDIVEIGKQLLDHPRLTHDLFHRQRRREVLRHYPGAVCLRLRLDQ